MTIAAGFRCVDGVLLCADSQITVTSILKYPEPKIARLVGSGHAIFFTYAGDVDFTKMALDYLVAAMHKAETEGRDILEALREEVLRVHAKYAQFGLELCMMVVIHTDKTRLYKISGPRVPAVPQFECIGSGEYLTRAICSSLYLPQMTLNEAARMAAFALCQAKKHVDGCGKRTMIVKVYDGGGWQDVEPQEIKGAERDYRKFLKDSRGILLKPNGEPSIAPQPLSGQSLSALPEKD